MELSKAQQATSLEGYGTFEARLDHELQRAILEELAWDPRVRPNHIGIIARDGVVTLTGWVDALSQRWAVEEAAQRVQGVRAIANDLQVRLPIGAERTDEEIAKAALRALEAHVMLEAKDIAVTVSRGSVTLRGAVDWEYQKQDAELAVRDLRGVRGIVNLLTTRA